MFAPEGSRRADWLYAAAVAVIVGIGLRLFWPTLDAGLFVDDYFLVAAMDGKLGVPRAPLDLFNFFDGTPEGARALTRLGAIAWWAAPDFRISFLRPLSSVLLHVDRAVFGDNLVGYHAHSLLAWVALVVAVSLLYRRLLPRTVAALATAMFAFDQSQHLPVAWLCNRGALYAVLVGVLAIRAHLRWRIDQRPVQAWLSAFWLCIGVLFGEWSLPMFAYLLAFEAVGTGDAWRKRVLALLPAGAIALAFLSARTVLGYGARGSSVYVEPATDPFAFVGLMFQRVPVFVADMLFDVPIAWWDFGSPWRDRILRADLIPPAIWARLPGWHTFHLLLGVCAVAAFVILLRWTWRNLDAREGRHARWLALGAFLALLPVVGSFPSTRLTLAACIGFAAIVSLFLREVVRRVLALRREGFARTLGLGALGIAILRVQLVTPLQFDLADTVNGFRISTEWVRSAELDPVQVARQRVYLLAATEFTTTFYFAYTWGYYQPMPRSFVPLTVAPWPLEIERTAADVLVLRTLGGTFMDSAPELYFRTPKRPLRSGESVRVEGVRIEVVDMLGDKPTALRMQFERPLEHPHHVFLASTYRGLRRVPLPAVGEVRRIPRAERPNWIALDRSRYVERIGPVPEVLNFVPTPYFVRFKPP